MDRRFTRRGAWPIGHLRRIFGTDSQEAYRQALLGLYMVELFTRSDFADLPELVRPGTVHRCTRGSPRRRTLNEPVKVRTPWADLWTKNPRTDFVHDGSGKNLCQSFSASPAFVGCKKAAAGIG